MLVKDKAEIRQHTTPLSQFPSRRHGVSMFRDRAASFAERVLAEILLPPPHTHIHLNLHLMSLSCEYRELILRRSVKTQLPKGVLAEEKWR